MIGACKPTEPLLDCQQVVISKDIINPAAIVRVEPTLSQLSRYRTVPIPNFPPKPPTASQSQARAATALEHVAWEVIREPLRHPAHTAVAR